AADRHDVAGALDQPLARQVGPSWIAEQRQPAPRRNAAQESYRTRRHWVLIADIPGQHGTPAHDGAVEDVARFDRDGDAVERGVEFDRYGRERVDLSGDDPRRTGLGGGDGDDPRARANVEDLLAGDGFGVV